MRVWSGRDVEPDARWSTVHMSASRHLRCADFGEHAGCLTLIDGGDRGVGLERLRAHLREAGGVTPAGFARRRRELEARLDDHTQTTKE